MQSVKVKILTDFVATGNRSLRAGEEMTMQADEAHEYQRAGFLRVVTAEPAVKVVAKPKAGRKAIKGG